MKFLITIFFRILDDNKVEKVEEPNAVSEENSADGENQSDDEDEPLVIFLTSHAHLLRN